MNELVNTLGKEVVDIILNSQPIEVDDAQLGNAVPKDADPFTDLHGWKQHPYDHSWPHESKWDIWGPWDPTTKLHFTLQWSYGGHYVKGPRRNKGRFLNNVRMSVASDISRWNNLTVKAKVGTPEDVNGTGDNPIAGLPITISVEEKYYKASNSLRAVYDVYLKGNGAYSLSSRHA